MKYIIHGLKKYGSVSGTPLYFEMLSGHYPFTQYENDNITNCWLTADVDMKLNYFSNYAFALPGITQMKDNNSLASYFPLGFEFASGRYRKDISFSLSELNGDFSVSCPNIYASVPSEVNWSFYNVAPYNTSQAYTGNNYLPLSDISVDWNVGDNIGGQMRYNKPTITGITTIPIPSFKAYTDSTYLNEGTSQFENGFEVFNYPNAASDETHIRFKPCKYRQYYRMYVVYISGIKIDGYYHSMGYTITNIEKVYTHTELTISILGVD